MAQIYLTAVAATISDKGLNLDFFHEDLTEQRECLCCILEETLPKDTVRREIPAAKRL